MSHVIDFNPNSVEQKIKNLNALSMACECVTTKNGQPALRLRLMKECALGIYGHLYNNQVRVSKGNAHYRTWKDDHNGRLVGDWPLPKGMTSADIGDNAVAVIELTEAAKKELGKGSTEPYEVGVVPHVMEDGELVYSLTHDFFSGGYGLENYVGKTKLDRKKNKNNEDVVVSAHEDILMFYQMMCAKLSAQEAGHDIEFLAQEDGTYVAIVDKQAQGVSS